MDLETVEKVRKRFKEIFTEEFSEEEVESMVEVPGGKKELYVLTRKDEDLLFFARIIRSEGGKIEKVMVGRSPLTLKA